MASHELYAKMEGFWTEFSENHSKFTDKGNKAAATRARKHVLIGYRSLFLKIEKLNLHPNKLHLFVCHRR